MIGEVLYSAQDAHTWLQDSGATFHVTPNIEWFSNYSADANGIVRLGNKEECKIGGTGEVCIREPKENTISLHRVRHVLDLKRSLVSIDMFTEDGYRTTLHESTWVIIRGNLKIGSGHKYNNFYPLMTINPKGDMNVAQKTDQNVWHGRLEHMSQVRLDSLLSVGYIPKLKRRWTSVSIIDMGNKPEVRTLSIMRQYDSP